MNGWSAFSGQTTLRRSLGFGLLLFIITLPGLVDDVRVNASTSGSLRMSEKLSIAASLRAPLRTIFLN